MKCAPVNACEDTSYTDSLLAEEDSSIFFYLFESLSFCMNITMYKDTFQLL